MCWYLLAGLGLGQVSGTLLVDLPWPCLSFPVSEANVVWTWAGSRQPIQHPRFSAPLQILFWLPEIRMQKTYYTLLSISTQTHRYRQTHTLTSSYSYIIISLNLYLCMTTLHNYFTTKCFAGPSSLVTDWLLSSTVLKINVSSVGRSVPWKVVFSLKNV